MLGIAQRCSDLDWELQQDPFATAANTPVVVLGYCPGERLLGGGGEAGRDAQRCSIWDWSCVRTRQTSRMLHVSSCN